MELRSSPQICSSTSARCHLKKLNNLVQTYSACRSSLTFLLSPPTCLASFLISSLPPPTSPPSCLSSFSPHSFFPSHIRITVLDPSFLPHLFPTFPSAKIPSLLPSCLPSYLATRLSTFLTTFLSSFPSTSPPLSSFFPCFLSSQ